MGGNAQQGTTPENGIIFLRGVRSDNGRIILTRDDTIRLQDGVISVSPSIKDKQRLDNELLPNSNHQLLVGQNDLNNDTIKTSQVLINQNEFKNQILVSNQNELKLGNQLVVGQGELSDGVVLNKSQIFVNRSDLNEGLVLNKRQQGTPLLLYATSGDVANGNVFLRTAVANDENGETSESKQNVEPPKEEKMVVPVGSGK